MVDSSDLSENSDLEGSFDLPPEIPEVLFPLPISRELYLHDQNCFTCKCKLQIPGLANRKKEVCLFCYRGSCPPCLRFSYFHSESSSIEPMCITCRYKLIDMHHNQSMVIEKLRLERIELRKQLNLATEQKKLASFERNMMQNELESTKKRMEESKKSKKTEKFQETLSKKHKDLSFKANRLQQKNQDLEHKNEILRKRYDEMTGFIELLQQQKKLITESEDLRTELNFYYFKIAKIREKTENLKTFRGKDEIICEEIEELELQIIEMNEISMNMSLISEDLKSQIKENELKIQSLEEEQKKLCNFRSEISEEEEIILKSLTQQIRGLDDLIKINEKIQENLEDPIDFNLKNFRSSSILDTQVTEENFTNTRRHSYQGPVHKNCIKRCTMF